MYLLILAFSFIILIGLIFAYPHVQNLTYPKTDTVPQEFVLLTGSTYPLPVQQIDITQPLLHPVAPAGVHTKPPKVPWGSTDPRDVLDHPQLFAENPNRSHLFTTIPQASDPNAVYGSPYGDKVITIKLPHSRRLCDQIGEVRPPTFHIRGNAFLNGDHVAHPAIDAEGEVVPHVYITSWNKHTGEVTLRNDYTNWSGDFELGYYQECNTPRTWDDEWNVTQYSSYPVSI